MFEAPAPPAGRNAVNTILASSGDVAFTVARGDRTAYLASAAVRRAGRGEVTTLSGTARGIGGFGSTG